MALQLNYTYSKITMINSKMALTCGWTLGEHSFRHQAILPI